MTRVIRERVRRVVGGALVLSLAGSALAQQAFDYDGDSLVDLIRREIRIHPVEPVVGRTVVHSVARAELGAVPSKRPNDLYGWYVSPGWDANNDGIIDIIVTAPADLLLDPIPDGEPGGPAPALRGRVDLRSAIDGQLLLELHCPMDSAGMLFGLGAAAVPDQDGDFVPDIVVSGVRFLEVPPDSPPETPSAEWRWWVYSSATAEPIRSGAGPVGSPGCEFLLSNETVSEFWLSRSAAGDTFILPGVYGDVDGDGEVDEEDAFSVLEEWGSSAATSSKMGDLNGDGIIGAEDLAILLQQMGFTAEMIEGVDLEGLTEALRNGPDLHNPHFNNTGQFISGPICTMLTILMGGCAGSMADTFDDPGGGGGDPGGGDPGGPPPPPPPPPSDADGDGIPDDLDNDDDNDGVPDSEEIDPANPNCQLVVGTGWWVSGGFRPVADLIVFSDHANGSWLHVEAYHPPAPDVEGWVPSQWHCHGSIEWSISGPAAFLAGNEEWAVPIRILGPGRITATATVSWECAYGVDTSPRACSVTRSYSFTAVRAPQLRSVNFGGNGFRQITRDGNLRDGEPEVAQTAYESPQWLDANQDGDAADMGDRMFPVCFVRGSRLTVQTAVVSLDGGGAALPAFTIEGRSTDLRLMGPLAAGGGVGVSDPLQSVALQGGGIASLENTVGVEPRAISWRLHWGRDGRTTWRSIGNSSNLLYRVGGPPTTQTLYEGLLHIGCNAARGWPRRNVPEGDPDQDEQKLVDYIWAEFADREVRRTDGARLGYWRGHTCQQPAPTNFTTAALLKSTNGRCGAWANFFIDVLRAQGASLEMLRFIELIPDEDRLPADCNVDGALDGNYGLLVKQYHFYSPGTSGCSPYPFAFNFACYASWNPSDAFALPGTSAQDNEDPVSEFADHAIVKYGTRYYDPSYGSGVWESIAAYERDSIAGYAAIAADSVPSNPTLPGFGARLEQLLIQELRAIEVQVVP